MYVITFSSLIYFFILAQTLQQMCLATSEQHTCTSTYELLQTGQENSGTGEKNKLKMDYFRIRRLTHLQKGNKSMTRAFQNSTSCVCPSSRRVSCSPFSYTAYRRETPATTKQKISNWVSFPAQTEDQKFNSCLRTLFTFLNSLGRHFFLTGAEWLPYLTESLTGVKNNQSWGGGKEKSCVALI